MLSRRLKTRGPRSPIRMSFYLDRIAPWKKERRENWGQELPPGFIAGSGATSTVASSSEVFPVRSLVLLVSLLLLAVPASGEPRLFKCKQQPLPDFTLGPASNPSDAEVTKLCACIWSKLPEGAWEREVSVKIRR